MTRYVILNAALDQSNRRALMKVRLYDKFSMLFNTKYKHARIINICDKPSFDSLSLSDQLAIKEADKIMLLGHCYENEYLWDGSSKHRIGVSYITELLAEAFNSEEIKQRQLSIVACESLKFGSELIDEFRSYPNLIDVSVTARKYEVFANPVTGKKYNKIENISRYRLYHHSQLDIVYKMRFSIDMSTGEVRQDEITGSASNQRLAR